MDHKIALEEHWAVESTLADNARIAGTSDWLRDVFQRLLDIDDRRLAEMDRFGIERMVLSLNAPGIQVIADPPTAIAAAREANDRLAEAIAGRPDRFSAFAALPMQDPDAAAEELTRCVRHLGFKGALVNGFSQIGRPDALAYYDEPGYRPFWALLEQLDVPFYLHPRVAVPEQAQAYAGHPWLYSPVWDFAVQASVQALRLMAGGLFDDHPGLKIVLGHLGERIPYDIWRVDNLMRKLPAKAPATQPFSNYLRRNFFLTTSGQFHTPTLECALAAVGSDRILFAIDYPYEDNQAAATWFDAAPLTDADRRRIGRDNAVALLKLD